MGKSGPKYRYTVRVLSLIISFSFLLQEVVLGNPDGIALNSTPAPVLSQINVSEIVQNPSKLAVPFEYSSLKEVHPGTNGKLIVHIQDPHANYSGQMAIAKTLDRLMTSTGQCLILAEGAAQDATLTEAKAGIGKQDWQIAARRFLQDGVIVGAEYLNLTSDHSIKIMGVEEKDLYLKALETYGEQHHWSDLLLSEHVAWRRSLTWCGN